MGFDPHLPDCTGFSDELGHLTASGGAAIGQEIGAYYRANLPDP